MFRTPFAVVLACGAAACQTVASDANVSDELVEPAAASAAIDTAVGDAHEDRYLAFAQGACGGCHAVDDPGVSPNPEAPSFAAIANREGLTAETLAAWLRDAHNYPEVMDFDLEQTQVEMLVAYMLTMQDEDFRPPSF